MIGLDRLSLNQATVKRLPLREAVELCVRNDITGIGVWRDRVDEVGLAEAATLVRRAGLHVSSLCRGGFFTGPDPAVAIADTLSALEDAARLGADTLVLVSGGLLHGSKDVELARRMVAEAIAALAPRAGELGVRLGIEALHPMFCADRCVISTLGEALDLALLFGPNEVGVVVDTYHVWWDPRVLADIARAADRIVSFQLCDWAVPLPVDMLLGREHVGDGSIDFGPLAQAVLATGYDGFVEVEIFNQSVWDAPPQETVDKVRATFAAALS